MTKTERDKSKHGAVGTDHPAASLTLVLRREANGPELLRERVEDADLVDVRGEMWLENCLRKGRPDVALDCLEFTVVPLRDNERLPRCKGFAIDMGAPDGRVVRREFGIHALTLVADRGAKRLVASGVLQNLENYVYELFVEDSVAAATSPGREDADSFRISAPSARLPFLRVPISFLRKNARLVGGQDTGVYPVFYTAPAFARAERFSRKGAKQSPPVETGACLIGILCSCPESGEFFSVIVDALEVLDSRGTKFSLEYSSQSWARLDAIIQAMQSAHPGRALVRIGQAHGHNWLANEGKMCAECASLPVCGATNVFASLDDRLWTASVHSAEPYALCHIFGTSARNDAVHSLYGLRGGRLQERSFFVVPGFDPTPWEQLVSPNSPS